MMSEGLDLFQRASDTSEVVDRNSWWKEDDDGGIDDASVELKPGVFVHDHLVLLVDDVPPFYEMRLVPDEIRQGTQKQGERVLETTMWLRIDCGGGQKRDEEIKIMLSALFLDM